MGILLVDDSRLASDAQLLGGQTDHTCDYPINYYTLFTAFTVNNPVKESLNYVNYVILLSGL